MFCVSSLKRYNCISKQLEKVVLTKRKTIIRKILNGKTKTDKTTKATKTTKTTKTTKATKTTKTTKATKATKTSKKTNKKQKIKNDRMGEKE